MLPSSRGLRFAFAIGALLASAAPALARTPSLDEYRYFRALSLDLLGRVPTRAELTAFERDDFSLTAHLDKLLAGPGYAERLTRLYLDLLRLEDSPAFTYAPPAATLHRVQILDADGRPTWLYYRRNQRRPRPETDGELCFSAAEAGFTIVNNGQIRGKAIPVARAALLANTVVVRPWWLYRDWDAPQPMQLIGYAWPKQDPAFVPVPELLTEPDGRPTVEIRVCKEEAQTAENGHVYVAGRAKPAPGTPPPFGRARPLPGDDGYAIKHAGEPLSCRSALSLTMSVDCGCGPGLVACMPGADDGNDPRAFSLPPRSIVGLGALAAPQPQNVSAWHRTWWAEEAVHFLMGLFSQDHDLREMLTARSTFVNGPLAHFYRYAAQAGLGGREKTFGMTIESEPLFDPSKLPADLRPADASIFRFIPDRGPHASGILTMPIFLTKYASRRARGAALYSAFWCKTFTAGNEMLAPSTEPNLMVRPGCAACHATLEPLAAYFARVEEASWSYLADWQFPLRNLACKANRNGKINGACDPFYDPAFVDANAGLLRGAYASVDHAAAGPAGAAEAFTHSPAFARCAVERITGSFLGRPITGDDEPLVAALLATFEKAGEHPRALVRAIVTSSVYRRMSAGGAK
jgi:hypothetical protein